MVSAARMALSRVDKLLAAYVVFVTFVIVARGGVGEATAWLLGAHALFGCLLLLFTRLAPSARIGSVVHDLYPLLLLLAFYTEIGFFSASAGADAVLRRDLVVQGWEQAIFGMQVSYEWIRRAPSVFWSGILHLAYALYFPIVAAGPILLVARGERDRAHRVLLSIMLAYVTCYVVFILWPVGGPNYAFAHPTGAVRDVWSARMVYGMLGPGSAFGAAFPSSHVAATVAAVGTLWRERRRLALVLLLPAVLLVVGTVYCQMHYAIDAVTGMAVGVAAVAVPSLRFLRRTRPLP